jgi:hypothetical protein
VVFGNSGVENVIPWIMDLDKMGNWSTHFRYVKQMVNINTVRMLINSIIDMPFPLFNRELEMVFYVFNNIEVNKKLTYMIRTYDHDFWIPKHVQKIGNKYLKDNAKERNK